MRVSERQMVLQTIASLVAKRASINRVSQELSSGRKLLSPADDPAASSQVLGIRQALQATAQFQVNANIANGRLSQEETLLASVGDNLQRVRELVIQGKNGTLSASDRRIIAAEVTQRLEELLALANSKDANGEFVFAGFQGKTTPFTRNAAGQVIYNGDQGQRFLQIGAAHQVPDRDSGHDVFMATRAGNGTFATSLDAANTGGGLISAGSVTDPTVYQAHDFRVVFTAPGTYDVINDTTATTVLAAQPYSDPTTLSFNGAQLEISGQPAAGDVFHVKPSAYRSVFSTVEAVIGAMRAPQGNLAETTAFYQAADQALVDLDQSLENILRIRTDVGGRLKAVDSQSLINEDLELRLNEVRSGLEDVDIVDASIRLNEATTVLQAAQQAYVLTNNLSLFNFL